MTSDGDSEKGEPKDVNTTISLKKDFLAMLYIHRICPRHTHARVSHSYTGMPCFSFPVVGKTNIESSQMLMLFLTKKTLEERCMKQ